MSKYGHRIGNWFEAIVNRMGGEKRADAFLNGELVITEPSSVRRLKFHSTVDCPRFERFEAKGKFKKGMVNGIKFYDFNEAFKRLFFLKVEINIAEATLRSYELLRNSKDLGILKEIEDSKEVTSLAHLYHTLTLQGEGQEGDLLINGSANIFYFVDKDGHLWSVGAYWCDDGWNLDANPVGRQLAWLTGRQVFTC